jgi:hypothetical protein
MLRPLLRLLTLLSLTALVWVVVACSGSKPETLVVLDASETVSIIDQHGAQHPAAERARIALGHGVKVHVPDEGYVYLVVTETRRVTYLSGPSEHNVDELIILKEPPTDETIDAQVAALQQAKKSRKPKDGRVAAFHQGVRSAVTIGHEARQVARMHDELPQAKGAPSPSPEDADDGDSEKPGASESDGRQAQAEGGAKVQLQSRAVQGNERKELPRDLRLGENDDADGATTPRRVGKKNKRRKAEDKPLIAQPILKPTSTEPNSGAMGGGGGAGQGVGKSQAPADQAAMPPPGAAAASASASLSAEGVVLQLKGTPAAVEAARTSIKSLHRSVHKCAAVKALEGAASLTVSVTKKGSKLRYTGATDDCLRKALSKVAGRVPDGAVLQLIVERDPKPARRRRSR